VKVVKFFDPFFLGEDVEVVIAGEPERPLGKLFGYRPLEGAKDCGEWVSWWLGE
jgi:hypothetical protein